MSGEQEYLSPSFDPSSLTVPRIRNILVTHNVTYPASAKKPELVELFNKSVVPQAKKVLGQQSRTKRTTRGIVDVPSTQSSAASFEDEDDTIFVPVSRQTGFGGSRHVSKKSMGTNVDDTPRGTTAPVMTNGHLTSGRASATQPDIVPAPEELTRARSSRKTRQSRLPPPVEVEGPEPKTWKNRDPESPFSSDNPFQSGSSPPQEARSVSGERRRRKTVDSERSLEKDRSIDPRRKTDNFRESKQQNGALVRATKSSQKLIVSREDTDSADGLVEAGEEFTPDEQMELTRERAHPGGKDLVPLKPRRPKESSSLLKFASAAISLALLGGFGFVWREAKSEVGYCGVGRASSAFAGVELPDWASTLQPQCEPCPQHAYCYPNMKTICEPGFVLTPHPLSLGGLVPLPPTCEPDGEKARKVKAVADRVTEELRERNAKWECGELTDEEGKHVPSPKIDEEELKRAIAMKRRKGMSQEEFENLWSGGIEETLGREEVVSTVDRRTGHRTLRSTSLARISLPCAIRRSIRLALVRNLGKLIVFLFILSSGGYARYAITSGREMETRAKQLASLALDRLSAQAALNAQDAEHYPEAWISMAQLRDDVLRDEFSASRRQKLWEKVQKKVEQNSNVRPMVREGRSGDVSRVWEWIGAVGALEDVSAWSRNTRGSARYSLGPVGGSSPVGSSLVPVGEHEIKREIAGRKHWDEGRPIF